MRTITINKLPVKVYWEETDSATASLAYVFDMDTGGHIKPIERTRLLLEDYTLWILWTVGLMATNVVKATQIEAISDLEAASTKHDGVSLQAKENREEKCRIRNSANVEFFVTATFVPQTPEEREKVFEARQLEQNERLIAAMQSRPATVSEVGKNPPETPRPAQTPPEYFTTRQSAAKYAGVTKKTITQWILVKGLPDGRQQDKDGKPIGRKLQIKRSDLDRFKKPTKPTKKPVKKNLR